MKTPDSTKAKSSGLELRKFTVNNYPRHLRVMPPLQAIPHRREDVDYIAGCSNGPDLIAAMRGLGLEVPCQRIRFFEHDGKSCRLGAYSFTTRDSHLILAWQAKRKQGASYG